MKKKAISGGRRAYILTMRILMGAAAVITAALVLFLIVYVLVKGLPNVSWTLLSTAPSYLSDRIGILPDLLNTLYIVIATLLIVLPLVAPGIAAVAMLSFMYAWNEYTYTVIFTRTAANNTVPLALALLNTEDNLTNFGLVAAGGVVSVIPITLFVIFAQNYLISGLSSGAVKE